MKKHGTIAAMRD